MKIKFWETKEPHSDQRNEKGQITDKKILKPVPNP